MCKNCQLQVVSQRPERFLETLDPHLPRPPPPPTKEGPLILKYRNVEQDRNILRPGDCAHTQRRSHNFPLENYAQESAAGVGAHCSGEGGVNLFPPPPRAENTGEEATRILTLKSIDPESGILGNSAPGGGGRGWREAETASVRYGPVDTRSASPWSVFKRCVRRHVFLARLPSCWPCAPPAWHRTRVLCGAGRDFI